MWYTDSFGWPITARPYASTSTLEQVEVSEVLNKIVQRACLFTPYEDKKPNVFTTPVSTTTTTTANLSFANRRAKGAEGKTDEILKEPVQAAASYSDLVSLISNFLER